MTFLPIVDRELRVTARRPGTHWLRFGAGLVGIVVWSTLVFGTGRWARPAALGMSLFVAMSVTGLIFALLAGVFLTADCLSMEKREGTLGLLFLTDLKGYDVVLGKLAVTSLHGVYGLLTILPVMALSMMLGGVTAGEVARQALVLLVTLLFSLSVGLFVSALSRETQHALAASFLVMVGVAAIIPALCALGEELKWCDFADNWLNWLSPPFACGAAFDSFYRTSPHAVMYWCSLAMLGWLSLVLLWLACRLLPRHWQEKESGPRAGRKANQPRPAIRPWAERAMVLERNPFLWLAGRDTRTRQVARWTLFGLMVVWLGFFVCTFHRRTREFGFAMGLMGAYLLHQALKLAVAAEASRHFSVDRANGALEVLLASPLPVQMIPGGQWAALQRMFTLPVLLLVLVNVALVCALARWTIMGMNLQDVLRYVYMLGGGLVLLVADVWALSWVGMEQGLLRKRHHWAVLAALGKVMGGPWLGFLLFIFLTVADSINSERTALGVALIWQAISLVLAGVVGGRAAWRVRHHFRLLAAGEMAG